MHEKVAVIDGRILWHGSLNVLSHNDTRESMLRFESRELVDEILRDLDLKSHVIRLDEPPAPVAGEADSTRRSVKPPVRTCPICGRLMRFFDNVSLWLCDASPRCPGTLPLTAPATPSALEKQPEISRNVELMCPNCEAAMHINRGVFTRVTCTSDACGFALDSRLSNWLLKALTRSRSK
jgi:hypothetical protein